LQDREIVSSDCNSARFRRHGITFIAFGKTVKASASAPATYNYRFSTD
jgi:hypothetical protein